VKNAYGLSPRAALWLLLLSGAGGCTASQDIDVTRRTSLSNSVKGTPFMVLLSPDEGDDPSYQNYAHALSAQLQARGLTTVNEAAKARYAVMLERDWPHHGQSEQTGQNEQATPHDHGMGGGGGIGHGGAGGHHHRGSLGGSQEDSHDTLLRIAIFDLTKPNRPDEQVFFAKAQAATGKDDSDAAVDAMIGAALRDFPGKAGERYDVALPK
jgi:hypothetical protein